MLEIISNCGEHNKKVINLITSNACSGGAFFDTDQPLPEGTDVKIELVLSIDKLKKIKGKQAFIKVAGQVIRLEQKGMAICFENNYTINSIYSD